MNRRNFFSSALTPLLTLIGLGALASKGAEASSLPGFGGDFNKTLFSKGYSSVPAKGYVDMTGFQVTKPSGSQLAGQMVFEQFHKGTCPTENPNPLFQFWLNSYEGSLDWQDFYDAIGDRGKKLTHVSQVGPYFAMLKEGAKTIGFHHATEGWGEGKVTIISSLRNREQYTFYYSQEGRPLENVKDLPWDCMPLISNPDMFTAIEKAKTKVIKHMAFDGIFV